MASCTFSTLHLNVYMLYSIKAHIFVAGIVRQTILIYAWDLDEVQSIF